MDTTAFLVLAAALLSVVVGLAKLGAWLIERREADRARVIREASIIAGARSAYLNRTQRLAEDCQ